MAESLEIGIIGAGDMGFLYARKFAIAGYRVNICDLPANYQRLLDTIGEIESKYELKGKIYALKDGYEVSRRSDYIIYSVEAPNINNVVKQYGKSTKVGAIVGGQTSVKSPEVEAFYEHLPADVNIVTMHSLHGPTADTTGQTLAVIRCRSTEEKYQQAVKILECLESEMLFISPEEHDKFTANTQTLTHICYLSLGTAWKTQKSYPWDNPQFNHFVDNVKISIALHIYGSKSHVYSGLAIMNPMAKPQLNSYVDAITMLYKMMVGGQKEKFTELIMATKKTIFERAKKDPQKRILLLLDSVIDKLAMPKEAKIDGPIPNSHLSLLATAVCWYQMNIDPYEHLVCQTPPFRLWLGIIEYLFCNDDLLNESINAALNDKYTQAEDLVFFASVLGWEQCINLRSFDGYEKRFNETKEFFQHRLTEARGISSFIIDILAKDRLKRFNESKNN